MNMEITSRAVSLDDTTLIFYVLNLGYGAYMKLGNDTDGYNDRIAYAHEGGIETDDRFRWKFTSLGKTSSGDDTYSLQNYSSSSPGWLFMGSPTDSDGDHTMYGHNTSSIDNSKGNRYIFTFQQINNNPVTYSWLTVDGSIVNSGTKTHGDSDHKVYASTTGGSGNHYEWCLIPVT